MTTQTGEHSQVILSLFRAPRRDLEMRGTRRRGFERRISRDEAHAASLAMVEEMARKCELSGEWDNCKATCHPQIVAQQVVVRRTARDHSHVLILWVGSKIDMAD